jgi:hypothetical protein
MADEIHNHRDEDDPPWERKDWEPFLVELRALLAKYRLKIGEQDEYDGEDNFVCTKYAFVDEWDGWYHRALPMVDLMSWIHPIVDKRPDIIKRALEGVTDAKPISELPPPDRPLYPSTNGGELVGDNEHAIQFVRSPSVFWMCARCGQVWSRREDIVSDCPMNQ